MKTETLEQPAAATTDPKPGNLSVRQLAASLKTIPAKDQTTKSKTETAETETPATARETTPPPKGKSKVKSQSEPSETESAETETVEDPNETPQDPAEQPAEDAPATEDPETEPAETPEEEPDPEQIEEPKSISDHVSERLNEELGELITSLKGQNAKGALQILEKRIPKLVDQRDTERNGRLAAEEQNVQLRRELQEARTKPGTNGNGSQSQQSFVSPEVQRVNGELANVDHWLAFCEDALPGLTNGDATHVEVPDGKGRVAKLGVQEVKAIRRDLQNQRSELVAQKAVAEQGAKSEYNRQFKQYHETALREYPAFANPNSPQSQDLKAVLTLFPVIKQSPDYEVAIGDMLAGKALRESRAKAKTNGTALRKSAPPREPTKVTTSPPTGGADPDVASSAEREVKAADAQFKKTGRMTDLAKLSAAKARLNRVRGLAKAA